MVPSSKGKNLLPDSVHHQNQFPSSEASTVLSFGEIVYVYTGKYIYIFPLSYLVESQYVYIYMLSLDSSDEYGL